MEQLLNLEVYKYSDMVLKPDEVVKILTEFDPQSNRHTQNMVKPKGGEVYIILIKIYHVIFTILKYKY